MRKKVKHTLFGILSVVAALALTVPYVLITRADVTVGSELYFDGTNPGGMYHSEGPDGFCDDSGDGQHCYYDLDSSTSYISFGTVDRDSGTTDYQEVFLYNNGDDSIILNYFLSDAEKVFFVDAPDSLYLGPGQSTSFYFAMRTDAAPSSYYGMILIGDSNDPGFMFGSTIELSGTIRKPDPYITYVSVSPGNVDVSRGSSCSFYADVRGENNPDTRVNWRISSHTASDTYITDDGVLYIGNSENTDRITVTAVSMQDQSMRADAYANITGGRYTVTASSSPNEGGSTAGGGTFNKGDNVSLYASPNNGYVFNNWTENGKVVSNSQRYDIQYIRENHYLTANFSPSACFVKVVSNIPDAGTISPSSNVAYNGSITLQANPNSGYRFEGWYEGNNCISTNPSVYITGITSSREITARFSQDIFNVALRTNPSNAGSVYGEGNYKKGADVTIKAVPFDNYEFENWTCNNNVIGNSKELIIKKIEGDYVITANFREKKVPVYKIDAVVASGIGTVSPIGVTQVSEGNGVVYSFAPAAGYMVSAVAVDGKQVGAVSTYTFSNVKADHTVAVAFVPRNDGTGQTLTPAPAATLSPNIPEVLPAQKDDSETQKPTPTPEAQETVTGEVQPENVFPEPITAPDDEITVRDGVSGVLQTLNISKEDARTYIRNRQDKPLMEQASREQLLKVSVYNEFAANPKETEEMSYMNISSIPNMEAVVDSLFSEDEKLAIFGGEPMGVNFSLFECGESKSAQARNIRRSAEKEKVSLGPFFEAVLMKSSKGSSEVITDISVPMLVVINVPKELRSDNRKFCIIRAHETDDGNITISYLKNESPVANQIAFTTDKFSTYAIGYVGGEENASSKMIALIAGGLFLLAMFATLVVAHNIMRRHRHKK